MGFWNDLFYEAEYGAKRASSDYLTNWTDSFFGISKWGQSTAAQKGSELQGLKKTYRWLLVILIALCWAVWKWVI